MKKKLLLLILFPLLTGCSGSNNTSKYDPFMIGDNLEVISSVEAKLIANEAYDNLSRTTSLIKTSTVGEDNTKFYTGAFSSYATSKKTTTESQAYYYTNKIESTRNVSTTTYIGNDSTIENRNVALTEWYGIKPVEEGKTPSENYSLLRRTIDKYNGVSSTRYSSTEDFSTQSNVAAIWNRHVVESIGDDYLTTGTSYSSDFTYVRDNQHTLGYYLSSVVTKETSKIAPGKEDVSYVKKVDEISIIDFYMDEVSEIGWTIKNVSSRIVTSYLTSIDGNETDPIEVSRQEDVTSLFYDKDRQSSEDIPTFVLDTSIPFAISKFAVNGAGTDLEFVTKYDMENNDDYYRHFEDSFTGHAYYKEQKLDVGFYSFFDGEPENPEDYEKWGYDDIIANKCVNYIIDPNPDDIDLSGLDFSKETLKDILKVDNAAWKVEAEGIKEFYKSFGNKLPKSLADQADELLAKVSK